MYISEHCTITARLRRFSSCDGKDSGSTEFDCDGEYFKDYFGVTFYANGNCPKNEGHVSIVFSVDRKYFKWQSVRKPLAFSCVASVIDASGNKRFPQSLVLDLDYLSDEDEFFFTKDLGFPKFVRRSTLLGDAPELLPKDCLTLCLEIDLEVIRGSIFNSLFHGDSFVRENGCRYLRMDTEFGRELCEMSTVFRNMMECTAVESGPDRIKIATEEYPYFGLIHQFLHKVTLHATTVSEICKMYVLADKYDMQRIVQLCHRLLISVLRALNTKEKLEYVNKDMYKISKLVERFEDERLREILEMYYDIKKKLAGYSRELDAYKLETEWNCLYINRKYFSTHLLLCKNKREHIEIDIYK